MWRPGHRRGSLTRPRSESRSPPAVWFSLRESSFCLLHGKGVRPDLKIGAAVLPVLPLRAKPLSLSLSDARDPLVLHIHQPAEPAKDGPGPPRCSAAIPAFRANAEVTFTRSGFRNVGTLNHFAPVPPPSLHCFFTQKRPLPPHVLDSSATTGRKKRKERTKLPQFSLVPLSAPTSYLLVGPHRCRRERSDPHV